jgi:cobalt-precorrin 5A hydrolase
MIIAGVGCRKGAAAAEIEAAIAAALAAIRLSAKSLDLIATAHASRTGYRRPAVRSAYSLAGARDLEAVEARTATRSQRVRAHMGVSSVAEAAALAAGGPQARLLATRIVVGPATCALAATGASL